MERFRVEIDHDNPGMIRATLDPEGEFVLYREATTLVRAAEIDRDAKEATLAMTVARLGGHVEGAPTARINFLQRVDELREIERKYRALYAKWEGDPAAFDRRG